MSAGEPLHEIEDDQVIGRAFRASLAVLVLLAGGVTAFVLLRRPATEPAPRETAPVAPPRAVPEPRSAPALPFTDVTSESGVDFERTSGATGERLLPETMGSGLAFLDWDDDGDPDLVLIDSRSWDPPQEGDPSAVRYFENDGTGHFTDRTRAVGLGPSFYGMGPAAGDVDGDGDLDLYVTAVGANHLFLREAGLFREVPDAGGAAGGSQDWSTAAGFFDMDRDGDLDLFTCNYVRWSRAIDLDVAYTLDGETRAYGPPMNYSGAHARLYRNDGSGRFTDVSAAAGIEVANAATGEPVGKGLGLAFADVDGDGWTDVFVANDTVRNFLFRNRGDGTFEEIGLRTGAAFDRDGRATGAMGVDVADYRNDGVLGFVVGNFANEMSSLYVVSDGLRLADDAIPEGLGAPSRKRLSFGVLFADLDLDGWLDLLQANGHLESEIARFQESQSYRQPAQLFWNAGADARSAFVEVPPERTGDLARPVVGRAAAYADADGDGDLDLCLTQAEGRPLLLRNDQELGNHWLRVALRPESGPAGGIGARLRLRSEAGTQTRFVFPTRGYLSQCELTATFGLGPDGALPSLQVTWPDGSVEDVAVEGLDRVLVVKGP